MSSYIPPHKRHPNTAAAAGSSHLSPSLPPPDTKVPHHFLQRKNDNKEKKKQSSKAIGLVYAQHCITKWFVVGLPDDYTEDFVSKLSTFTRFEPVVTDKIHGNSFALLLKENCEETRVSANPWEFIAETIKEDFVVSLQNVKNVIKDKESGVLKPYLIARFGKVVFEGHISDLECATKETLERCRRSFYVNVHASYMINISNDVVPKLGLDFLEEKDSYRVMLSDNTRPGSTISCKCEVMQDRNSLKLRKIEVIPVRHFIADMTCLDKNHDLRLMLITKRKSCFVTDEDLENIKSLIGFATLNQEMKGGVDWPLGKRSLGRHNVIAVWHTHSTMFKNSSMKLKVRVADRYNFRTCEGEVAREVSLKLNNVVSHLGEDKLDTEVAFEMLKENLELIWKHLLS